MERSREGGGCEGGGGCGGCGGGSCTARAAVVATVAAGGGDRWRGPSRPQATCGTDTSVEPPCESCFSRLFTSYELMI